jgi:glycosyltransferase involved in cell wall biosynthesis
MRILQIAYNLDSGGAERLVVDLSNELAKNNEVYLCTLRKDNVGNNSFYLPELNNNVKYINLSIEPGFKISIFFKFHKLIKTIKPDVVHCHLDLVLYIFFTALLKRNIKYIHTIHNDPFREIKNRLEFYIRKYMYKMNLVQPVTVSKENDRNYRKKYKLDNSILIFNGRKQPVVSEKYLYIKAEIEKMKANNDDIVFVHIGSYREQKNQIMLVKAFNKLISENHHALLIIIGAGFEKANNLKTIANKQIYFLGEKNNIADYLFLSDAFCLSSFYEGMPISLLEAFACGCTPICTPVGGIKSLISDKVNGYLASDTSERSYYYAISKYIENRNKIKGQTLIEFYKNNFTIEICAANYMKLFGVLNHKLNRIF